ncbi:hypothetical protein MMC07_007366 [Pseudocyphellaria aurata]|nr:hypothetical protein [Pseudocyphellaria aurata]
MFSPVLKDERWSAMDLNAQVTEPRTRISHLNLSKAALEKPDAVVGDGAAILEIIPSPEDKASVTRTQLRQLVEDDKAEQAANPIQQPKPLPRKRPYASFLADTLDQTSSSPDPKRYRPESVNRFITQWVESGSVSESYRERHCRSDSLLNHSDSDLISRRLTQSVPNMVNNPDAGESTKPTTPASAVSLSNPPSVKPSDAVTNAVASGNTNKSKNSVEDSGYRTLNLHLNNIFMRSRREEFPKHISDLINLVSRDRDSPEPSLNLKQENDLEKLARGAPEPLVSRFFYDSIFSGYEDVLHCSYGMPMKIQAVPYTGSWARVSCPKPDLLFGYDQDSELPQHRLLKSLSDEMTATTSRQAYPFLVVEFKGDSPGSCGSLWVGTNQCLGGAASCVNLAERLTNRLRGCKNDEIRLFNSAVFSITMSGTEARLFISWKHDELKYYLQDVKTFAVQEPDQYLQFRKYVRNILDWGKDQRLTEVRDSLDKLIEESRKRASAIAKSRRSPSHDHLERNSTRKRNARGAAEFCPSPSHDDSTKSSIGENNAVTVGTGAT